MNISPREHGRLARALIDACGGLDEAATVCRVSKSKLSDYQNPNAPLFMPADVIADLELYVGSPVYSHELARRFRESVTIGDLKAVVCELTETAAILQGKVRDALEDGAASPNELTAIADVEREVENMLATVKATRRSLETASNVRPLNPAKA